MAEAPEHACPMRRRVRRSAKKSFHVRALEDVGEAGAEEEGAVEALRREGVLLLLRRGEEMLCRVGKAACAGCWASALGRVLVEKEAEAEEELALRMHGGNRFANARAGLRALRASIVCCCCWCAGCTVMELCMYVGVGVVAGFTELQELSSGLGACNVMQHVHFTRCNWSTDEVKAN